MTVKTVGLDLAKDVFQVHCVSATGRRIINKKIKRAKLLAFFETLPRCEPPQLNWSTAMVSKPRTRNGEQATQVRGDCHEASAG